MTDGVEDLVHFFGGFDQHDIAGHVGRDDREFAGMDFHGSFADDRPSGNQLVVVVGMIEHEFGFTENRGDLLVDLFAVVCRPLGDAGEFPVEFLRGVDELVDVSGFAPGSGMDKEVQRPVVVGGEGVEEVVSASEIPQFSFVGTEPVGELVLFFLGEFSGEDSRGDQAHAASAIGERELAPVLLPGDYRGSCGKRGLAGAGVGEEHYVLGLQATGQP